MNRSRRTIRSISNACAWVARWVLVAMMLIVVAGILMRQLQISTMGIYELVCLLAGIMLTFGWSYAQVERSHLRVDMVVSHLSPRAQSVIDSITGILSVGICFLMSWFTVLRAQESLLKGELIAHNIKIPFFPVIFAIGFSLAVFGIALLIDLVDSIIRAVRK